MTKTATVFACTNCDAQFSKWTGRCLECGKWGSVEQHTIDIEQKTKEKETERSPAKTIALNEIAGKDVQRLPTTMSELDRVVGGGIVPGSLILLGGEPGIGKSTLALQLATVIKNSLYISAEESVEQIKLRAERLFPNIQYSIFNIQLANETNVETISATIKTLKPQLTIVDSIQTIYSDEVTGEAGAINQVRACTVKLLETAKSTNTAIILIGHVTKEGLVAGPKTLEHLVDTVLYLEGERFHTYRILRAVKNRFGPTDEVGIFEMTETGMKGVDNPSAAFLQERGEPTAGSIITCLMEGTRPLLVEIQALVNKTVFGYPVRKASGFDLNRLHVLIAVLQKRAGLNLGQYDIHLNVVGGIKADEPAADLAVCLAIASSYKDKALGKDLVVFGEVGLGGEVRSVGHTEKRIKECEHLGMQRAIVAENAKLPPQSVVPFAGKNEKTGLKVIGVKNIQELITHT